MKGRCAYWVCYLNHWRLMTLCAILTSFHCSSCLVAVLSRPTTHHPPPTTVVTNGRGQESFVTCGSALFGRVGDRLASWYNPRFSKIATLLPSLRIRCVKWALFFDYTCVGQIITIPEIPTWESVFKWMKGGTCFAACCFALPCFAKELLRNRFGLA